jgi:YD repeat-containing protein
MLLVAAAIACGGSDAPTEPGPPDPPPVPAVRLKDIVIPRLPAPYYHFTYDANGRVDSVSFASELTRYQVAYDASGRIKEMRNNILVNRDRIVYAYDAVGRVSGVRYVDSNGNTYTVVVYTYDGDKLVGVERDRRDGNTFIIDKTMALTYDADGNLLELTEHRPAIAGVQDDATVVDRFEQYDRGLNVDGFDLLHDDFFDHLVLLPGVQLQKGNPRRQTRTGDGQNFTVDYTYVYDGDRPLSKSGELTYTNGANAGQRFQLRSDFTYY